MTAALITALVLGGGALALWAYVRYPTLTPTDWRVAAAHVALALVALNLAPLMVEPAADLPGTLAASGAVVGAVLIPLAYMSLAVLWLLRTMQGLMTGAR